QRSACRSDRENVERFSFIHRDCERRKGALENRRDHGRYICSGGNTEQHRNGDMSAKIIDGKAFAARLRAQVEAETARLKKDHGITPGLATVLVGNDPASEVYIRNKNKTAEAIGFNSVHHHLPDDASEADVLALVTSLNADKAVHGILVQMPLPKQVREAAVLDTLDPAKDVDALTPTNAGLLLSGRASLVSCTPAG